MKLNNNDDSHNSGLNLLIYNMLLDIESHPAWVCGLKLAVRVDMPAPLKVTPCVGVWIETIAALLNACAEIVTPCVGVWIETKIERASRIIYLVTPCVGVWIETKNESAWAQLFEVTPCVGVWIETRTPKSLPSPNSRHTLRGCVD